MGYCNQTWQDGRLTCTDLTVRVMIASSQVGHVTNINGVIPTFARPMIVKLDRVIDQYDLTPPCCGEPNIIWNLTERYFGILSPYFAGDNDVTIYRSRDIFTSTRETYITIKRDRLVDQHPLTLTCRWR